MTRRREGPQPQDQDDQPTDEERSGGERQRETATVAHETLPFAPVLRRRSGALIDVSELEAPGTPHKQ
jgi:hypothetical protein